MVISTEIQTSGQIDRQMYRRTDRQLDWWTEAPFQILWNVFMLLWTVIPCHNHGQMKREGEMNGWTDRQTDIQIYRQTVRQTARHMERWTDKKTVTQKERQGYWQTNGRKNRQTDRQLNSHKKSNRQTGN
jgi:hypothetical protein